MIKAILVFNNHGKPRLSKFYTYYNEDMQQRIIRESFQLVSRRDDNVCNFLEGGTALGGADSRLIYRHYATLYFVFCVDSSESELGILDLIQVFVETLDKCFENVCELDLIFHVDKVQYILQEIVMGGMVLETNMSEILTHVDAQNKIEKQEGFILVGCLNLVPSAIYLFLGSGEQRRKYWRWERGCGCLTIIEHRKCELLYILHGLLRSEVNYIAPRAKLRSEKVSAAAGKYNFKSVEDTNSSSYSSGSQEESIHESNFPRLTLKACQS